MGTWTTRQTVMGEPEHVLAVLTDPGAAARWAPIAFDVDDLVGDRLVAGSRARLVGRLAGAQVGFDIEVHAADERGLELEATGPIGLDVHYELSRLDEGSEVRASVSVHRGAGLRGRLLAQATDALLAAGALQTAVSRIAREVERAAGATAPAV